MSAISPKNHVQGRRGARYAGSSFGNCEIGSPHNRPPVHRPHRLRPGHADDPAPAAPWRCTTSATWFMRSDSFPVPAAAATPVRLPHASDGSCTTLRQTIPWEECGCDQRRCPWSPILSERIPSRTNARRLCAILLRLRISDSGSPLPTAPVPDTPRRPPRRQTKRETPATSPDRADKPA